MSVSYWLDRTRDSSKRSFDVVIIGAGITGVSAAYWLNQEDPRLKIAIIEKHRLGFGATGRNAGFVTCGSVEHFNRMISKHGLDVALEIWRFSEKNIQMLMENIVQDEASLIEFQRSGAYSLAAQKNEFDELKKVAKIMEGLAVPVEICNHDEVLKRVGAQNFIGGIKYLDDASVDPVKLLNRILGKSNVTLIEQTECSQVVISKNDSRILKTDTGDVECAMVIYALNGYSPTMNPFFYDKIYPTRAQILMMERVPFFMESPCYANFYLDYFRQLPTGELLIGGFRQLEKANEVGYSDHITDIIQTALHQFVMEHLPQFKNVKISHRWSGVMGFSGDGQPMVGSLPDDPQIYFAAGYTGHGLGLAFNTAKILVDLIYGRNIPAWLSAKRFAK